MKVLLDAHALLWFLVGSSQLSRNALACIQDSWNTIFVSPATLWEIGIKASLSKRGADAQEAEPPDASACDASSI